jgi:maltose alpha-D-glucosyltransferase/alpha-amylase
MLPTDPLWYKDAVIYEAHVRAFFDSVGEGVGEFYGLMQKLDYLQDLGVTAIWLLPFYPSPLRDDGYDIADYTQVHADYGTLDAFQEFLDAAHARGLRVITELVINHTSDQHPWFQRSRRAAPGTVERDFYVWRDSPEDYPEARIIFQDFETSNWAWDKTARAYYWHRFYAHQPDLNFDNPAVWKAIFPVVDFWFEKGVDGLRLDAVPYLYERPGTNCENLPETHAFLKELRSHVDRRFPDRMLLAEANQWPEDAVAYFGQGDECHMAFHFPLMPRLFMSIRMEDRLPLLDIIDQTPSIPEICQWALFLRNHDELTLEMVTDEERDYMYESYAADPRAKINLGIRHRLAPLLGNDRRRIELMNGLLFSLPGTPVLYYGDEIGMGDNIYLGDRNSVRTPMQWSGDRNAGFSRANPQRLYLPIIIDPQYHYESVNVETQQANPHSLLWWTKRLIALRRRHRAFGRGTLEFLRPTNRRVLAFVRRSEDESILVVANLSRFTQHAELDLSSFEGSTLVELFGGVHFPGVGRLPYPVMLGPHSFYWFALSALRETAASHTTDLASLPRILADADWNPAPGTRVVAQLEEALIRHLNRDDRRQAARVHRVRVADVVPMTPDESTVHLLFLSVATSNGAEVIDWLPVILLDEEAVQAQHPDLPVVIARFQGRRKGWICDATSRPEFNRRLIDVICRRQRLPGQGDAVLAGESTSGACPWLDESAGDLPMRYAPGNGGRPTTTLGEKCVLSYRSTPAAVDRPELELGRWLTERRGFVHAPGWIGTLQYQRRRNPSLLLAELQEYVPNEGNAWQFTLEELSAFFERMLASPPGERLPVDHAPEGAVQEPSQTLTVVEALAAFLETARQMAQRLAQLHQATSSAEDEPGFAPEAFTGQYQRSLYQSLRTLTSHAIDDLKHARTAIEPGSQERAEAIWTRRDDFHARLHGLLERRVSAWRIRIHGDFHLGQLLRSGPNFVLTGFDGGGRSAADRRIKRSPLCDLAGLLHSLDFASRCALYGVGDRHGRPVGNVRPEDVSKLQEWAASWRRFVLQAVADAYRASVSPLPRLANTDRDFELLMSCLRLEHALSEVRRQLGGQPGTLAGALELLFDQLGGAHE